MWSTTNSENINNIRSSCSLSYTHLSTSYTRFIFNFICKHFVLHFDATTMTRFYHWNAKLNMCCITAIKLPHIYPCAKINWMAENNNESNAQKLDMGNISLEWILYRFYWFIDFLLSVDVALSFEWFCCYFYFHPLNWIFYCIMLRIMGC